MQRNMHDRRQPRKSGRRSPLRGTCRPLLEQLEPRLAPANVDVLSYHNDLSLSGANLSETQLTTANVNPTQFGKLFSQPVDGYVYAEPLYKVNLAIPGRGTHNVAFVATEHDSVYAFDADSNTGANANPLWKTSFLDPANGVTTIPSPSSISNSDIVPEIGITGTPVIDGATNTLYVVAATSEVRSGVTHYVQKLHALDITTGAEKLGGPYTLGDTVFGGPEGGFTNVSNIFANGGGDGSDPSGVIHFNAARENNRSALQLVDGVVYVAFASHSDFRPYHGWLLGFDATTLQPVREFNTAPNAGGVGIWQSGSPISADAQGNLYFAVGNGFNGPNQAYDPAHGNYSESVLKLSATGDLSVVDYFTPFDWQTLDNNDADLGSGGVMLLPDSVGSAAHPHLMVETGKSGKIYLIDRDNMGHLTAGGPDNVVQIVTAGQAGVWGNPAFFQISPTSGIIYYHGSGDVLKGYYVSNGHIEDGSAPGDRPILRSPEDTTLSGFPGTQPVISADGITNPTNPINGIVWELQVDNFAGGTPTGNRSLTGPAFLRAYDATNLNNVLYDSGPLGQRDLFGDPIKFTVPTVTNGHVLVAEAFTFSVFGLFPAETDVPAAPSDLNAVALSDPQGQRIQLTWTNPDPGPGTDPTGIKIFRSTDGINFSLYNTVYRTQNTFTDVGPLQAGQRYYYRVAATNQQGDSAPSNTVSAVAPIAAAALTVTATGSSSISLAWTLVANDHYVIERSTDGTNFTPVATVAGFQTTYTDAGLAPGNYAYRIHAFNVNPTADSFSNVKGAWVGPTIDHGTGFVTATDLTTNGNTFFSPTEQLIRLTGANSQTGSVFSNSRVSVANFTTSFEVRLHEGTQPNYADGFTFVLQADDPTIVGQGGSGIGYRGIGHSVAVKFSTFQHNGDPSNSSVALVLNGADPGGGVDTTPSGVLLNSQDQKQIDLTYDGTTLSVRIEDLATHQVFTTSFTVNLAQVIGSDTAYAGFTAASGTNNYWELEDLLNWKFTSQVALPGAPTNLRQSGSTSSAIDLSWNGNSYNESGFQLERSLDGTSFTVIATTTAMTYGDQGLLNGTYFYRVRAFNSQGFSPYTATLKASLPGPALTQDRDVGTLNDPAIPGSVAFSNGTYSVTATGTDIWIPADRFHFVYQPLLGDGEIIARVVSIGRSDFYTKAGVMIRETLAADSKEAFMLEYPPPDHNQPTLNYRNQTSGTSVELFGPTLPATQMIWVRLVRSGNNFTGYYALDLGDGTHGPWIQVGATQTIPMNPGVYVGLALTSHNNGIPSTTTFDNVQVLPGVHQTTHLDVSSAVGAASPGTPISITVRVLDRYNNPVPDYAGTIHFTSSDPQAILPADYTFTAADNGVHTFTIALPTTGLQTVTVTDSAITAISGGTTVTVTNDAIASSLSVSGFPARILVGTPATFTVTALDTQGHTLTDYRGTVFLTTSDPLAQLPVSYTFTAADNGAHTFTATLNSLGTQTITATDLTDRVRGTQSGILVAPTPPVVTAGASITPTEGKVFDTAPAFDGTGGRNDYVQVPSTLVVGGAITIEAWVKNNSVLTPWARIIDFGNGPDTDNIIFGWNGNNPGHLYFETHHGTQTIMLVTPNVFPQGQWVHVAAVNDGNGMGFIYINGVLVASGPQLVPATEARSFQYIARSDYPDPFFQGSIQEVQIWRTARSASQIQSDMLGLTGNEPGLAAYYPMDEGSGTTIFDKTANHYDGTFTSTLAGRQPVWVADSWPGPGRVVATFTSGDPAARASDFTATITWANGQTSVGSISSDGHGGFNVTGSHTYAAEGDFPITVQVTDAFNGTGVAKGTVTVLDPSVVASGTFNVVAVAGVASRAQTVATFTDPGGAEALNHYSALIDWGDDTSPTVGTITFDAGTGVFTVQGSHGYDQAGSYPITVTIHHDAAADVTAASAAQVSPLVLHFLVAGFPSPTTAGNTGHFTVTALDQLDELVSNYGGTVHFTSSDPRAVLPADATLTNGTGTFTATLKTAGTQTITATDITNNALTAMQSVVVNPAAASYLVVSGYPSTTVKGQAHTFTVTAYDAYGNVATDYTGTVHFSSSDDKASLPRNYTFTAADGGVHTFSATFQRFGRKSLKATDTLDPTITGTEDNILVVNQGRGDD